jgi:hypothetical protein
VFTLIYNVREDLDPQFPRPNNSGCVTAWLEGQQAGQTVNIPFFVIVVVIVSISGWFLPFVTVSWNILSVPVALLGFGGRRYGLSVACQVLMTEVGSETWVTSIEVLGIDDIVEVLPTCMMYTSDMDDRCRIR